MKQFLGKRVKYIGKTNEKLRLLSGGEYVVTHTYGMNVGVSVGNSKIASISCNKLEIIGSIESSINIHSFLTHDGNYLGIRLVESNQFFDVSIDSINGLTENHFKGFKTEPLILHNDEFVTQMELDTGMLVFDKSNDKSFCKSVSRMLSIN